MGLIEPEYFVLVEFLEVVKTDDFDDSAVSLLKKIFVYSNLNLLLNGIDVFLVYQALHCVLPVVNFLNNCCRFTP